MDKKEFTTYKQPQSDKKALDALEGKDKAKEDEYQQAQMGTKSVDMKTMKQLSSSVQLDSQLSSSESESWVDAANLNC